MPVDTAEGRIDVAAGERILFKKNDKDLNIKNGEVGTVDRIIADRLTGRTYIQATLDDGRSAKFCTDEYDQIRYGYCVTAHASQGDTKQSAYIYASRFMSREMAYVMASRHKETAHIFASDEEFTEWSGLDTQTTEERIEFIMSTSHQKETAHQVMASHGYSIADILEGRASVDDLAADMTTDISSGLHGGMGTTK